MKAFQENRSLVDDIIEYLETGGKPENLPEKWVSGYEQLQVIHAICFLHKSKKVAIPLIEAKFPDMGISTIYKYIADSEALFGYLLQFNSLQKQYHRMLTMEMFLEDRAFATQLKDAKSRVAATTGYMKAAQVDKPDVQEIDASKVQPHNNIIVFLGGGDKEKARQLSMDQIREMPVRKRDKLIQEITEALLPETASFIDVPDDRKK